MIICSVFIQQTFTKRKYLCRKVWRSSSKTKEVQPVGRTLIALFQTHIYFFISSFLSAFYIPVRCIITVDVLSSNYSGAHPAVINRMLSVDNEDRKQAPVPMSLQVCSLSLGRGGPFDSQWSRCAGGVQKNRKCSMD